MQVGRRSPGEDAPGGEYELVGREADETVGERHGRVDVDALEQPTPGRRPQRARREQLGPDRAAPEEHPTAQPLGNARGSGHGRQGAARGRPGGQRCRHVVVAR